MNSQTEDLKSNSTFFTENNVFGQKVIYCNLNEVC